jgi:NAD(P)-dependent dehydrogenase (short-subunit alcohol dehydrogenase family)
VPRIDCLINNAGVFMTEYQASQDGHEMTFAVNVLAHYLLTNKLKVLVLVFLKNNDFLRTTDKAFSRHCFCFEACFYSGVNN